MFGFGDDLIIEFRGESWLLSLHLLVMFLFFLLLTHLTIHGFDASATDDHRKGSTVVADHFTSQDHRKANQIENNSIKIGINCSQDMYKVMAAGHNLMLKLASKDGMSLQVLVAYRCIHPTVFLAPLAFFIERSLLLASKEGMSLQILVAYRCIFTAIFLAPSAFFIQRYVKNKRLRRCTGKQP